MSLLDTFLVMFEADTSELDAELKSSDQKSDELLASLKKTDAQSGRTGETFSGFAAAQL